MSAVDTQTATNRVRNAGVHGSLSLDLAAVAFSRNEADADGWFDAARKLLDRLGPHGLGDVSHDDLKEAFGLDGFENLRCRAAIELGRRAGKANRGEKPERFDDPETVFQHLEYLRREKREHFVALLLDSQNQLLRTATIHVGTLNMSLVGPREVFREAIREGACSIVVAHNHPSGIATPSPEDFTVTKELVRAGKLLDIPVLDHIIVGHHDYTSLRRKGAL